MSRTRRLSTARALGIAAGCCVLLGMCMPDAGRAGTPFTRTFVWDGTYGGIQKTPDPNLAVGPLGGLHTNNARLVYATKSAAMPYYDVVLSDFFLPPTPPNSLVDIRSLYDVPSGRFFVTCLETSLELNCPAGSNSSYHAYLHVAVSKNSNPRLLTDWLRYRFDVTEVETLGGTLTHSGPDYPGLGIDARALYVTGNVFKLPVKACGSFRNSQIVVLDKAALLAGTAVPTIRYTPGAGIGAGFTLQPVSVLGPASPGDVTYFVDVPVGQPAVIRLWALQDPLGTAQLTSTLVPVRYHGTTLDGLWAPQCQGSPNLLRTWNNTAQGEAFWRDGDLWFAQTGDTLFRTRIQYYQLRTNGFPGGTPTLVANGVIEGGPGEWLFQPAIGGSPAGDIAITYTKSSATICPTMMISTRAAAEADFAPPQVVSAGTVPHDNLGLGEGALKSWGDFGSVSFDPTDSSLWVSHEISCPLPDITPPIAAWGHVWGNFVFPSNPAGWPETGRPLRRGATDVGKPTIVPDGTGGALVAWHDARNETDYMSHIGDDGRLVSGWSIYGNPTGRPTILGSQPSTVSDTQGGLYVVSQVASFGGRIWADRFDGSGAAAWPASLLISLHGGQRRAVPDGEGGCFVSWYAAGIHVQRVAPSGTYAPGWPPEGVVLSVEGDDADLLSDGAGGVFVACTEGADVVVRHVGATGVVDASGNWAGTGLVLAQGSLVRLIADGTGGAIAGYLVESPSGLDLRLIRFLASGATAPGWNGGVAAETGPGSPGEYALASDGSGGVTVAWSEDRQQLHHTDLYATRILADGTRAAGWPADGVRVCGAAGDQWAPAIAPDGEGGAVIAWADRRGNPTRHSSGAGDDIYWARVAGAGQLDGTTPIDGSAVCTAVGDQAGPAICLAEPGRALLVWADGRQTPAGVPAWTTEIYSRQRAFDVAAPAAVSNLAALQWNCSKVVVAWNAPGDDGNEGAAAAYDLRFSTSPITAETFASATAIATITPGPAGHAELDTLELGPCTQPRYFAIAALDEVGHVSGLSNVPVSNCLPCTGDADPLGRPLVDALLPPAPNPTHSLQRFDFTIAGSSAGRHVELSVFDAAGRLVKRLRSGAGIAGRQSLVWDLRDPAGRRVASGAYFIRLRVADRTFQRTVIVR